MNYFDGLARRRRSVRKYEPDPVPGDVINGILDTARMAPSWHNKQCWRFLVVTDREKIAGLCEGGKVKSGWNKWARNVPVFIAACGKPDESGVQNGMDYYLVDVAIAMDHLTLAATARGLGTCWIGAMDESHVRKVLGVPPEYRIVALTPLGRPSESTDPLNDDGLFPMAEKKRKPASETVFDDVWGTPFSEPAR